MARDEQALNEFAERSASLLAGAGFPRMPGRVLMMLMISETGGFTARELADRLDASAAAISGAVRYLHTLAMVRRVSQPGSRRDRYELPQHSWYTNTLTQTRYYDAFTAIVPIGIAAAGAPDEPAALRLKEMDDFYKFLRRRLPELLVEWEEEQRDER
ncbi:GbsR/MarR family transcriptional regulator [Rathayibacter soli]|uniref:GbsR/MarR family transcriptional regulator n=1 Tax=Rathayibacter soli TaxID=3144168 RepID=UPI0027E592FE|nr:MarR family transcriptional regulator [Glaciibacter superstes]